MEHANAKGTVELYIFSDEDLFESDEVMELAESKLLKLQQSIDCAKNRRNEIRHGKKRLVPVEKVINRVVTSGFLTHQELGRLLLKTQKAITKEFTNDLIWKLICQSRFNNSDITNLPFLVSKGYESFFRHVSKRPVYAPVHQYPDCEWIHTTAQLNSSNLLILVNIFDIRDGRVITCFQVPSEQIELLNLDGQVEVPIDLNLFKDDKANALRAQMYCFRMDTGESCCILDCNHNSECDEDHVIHFYDHLEEQGPDNLKLNTNGRFLLEMWCRSFDETAEDNFDLRSGISFCISIYLDEREKLEIKVNADTCTYINQFDQGENESNFTLLKVMETLCGW
eukprot:CAMPEP_0198253742 /NCGR_PEP_ID=MMETSP1447-20131203/4126_1 /TAXON_ID=420782 /ORGANISM="Chaetoceros dichaeta, Strain CCMP1751" /LENGTH=338 /DNA_ID=CAMNT_0043939539 /DNA_START=39 /DNA_END=1052 /DNA_ORIENTATION=-